jgi:hypothetical protein
VARGIIFKRIWFVSVLACRTGCFSKLLVFRVLVAKRLQVYLFKRTSVLKKNATQKLTYFMDIQDNDSVIFFVFWTVCTPKTVSFVALCCAAQFVNKLFFGFVKYS